MFIRTFIQAETKKEAEAHLNKLLIVAEKLKIRLEVTSIEPYWKIDDYFQIELNGTKLTDAHLSLFLKSIASKWSKYPDSFLATTKTEGCTILMENVEFIEVFNDVI